jgi:hypothetical protein
MRSYAKVPRTAIAKGHLPGCVLFHSERSLLAGGGPSERSASRHIGARRSPSDRSVPYVTCLSDAEGPAPAPSQPAPEGGLFAEDFQGFEPFELQGFAFPCETFELLVLLSEGVEV